MLQRLVWGEVFTVGHAALDAEHRDLVDHINRICTAVGVRGDQARHQPMFIALVRAVREHFTHETAVLRELARARNAPAPDVRALTEAGILEHAAEHGRALTKLQAIVAAIEGEVTADASTACDALVKWFVDHAIGHDAHLKTVFQAI
jgi:hemerythrin-like metal-binding protein